MNVTAATTPLHVAAACGHISAIKALIELGAQKNVYTDFGRTALHDAASNGKTAAVIALINDHGFDPNAADSDGRTPLFDAAYKNGNFDTFNALIGRGARVEVSDRGGMSVLHVAAQNNKPAIIVALIRDHNLDPNKETALGSTPLGCSIKGPKFACVAWFTLVHAGAQLSNGEKVDYPNPSGSCLDHLKTTADRQIVLDALAQESLAHWDPNVTDTIDRTTPLITAVKRRCLDCVNFLLKDPRTDLNKQDRDLKTALHYSVLNWQTTKGRKICSRLLNLRRTKVGIKDTDGKTARQHLDAIIIPKWRTAYDEQLYELVHAFDLRKMRVQAYLSLKNARCSKQCSEKVCVHLPQLPADVVLKSSGCSPKNRCQNRKLI